MASRSRSPTARRSRSSARTAPARRRCCARSPARTGRPAGRILFDGGDITSLRAHRRVRDGHRARPRGPPALPRAHRRGEPARRRLHRTLGPLERRRRVGGLSPARAAAIQAGVEPLRRRAAGDRDRPGADDEPAAAAPRRGLARPRAGRRRRGLPLARQPDRERRHDRAGRAGPGARDAGVATRVVCMLEGRVVLEGALASSLATRSSTRTSACERSGRRRDLGQRRRAGHPARRALRAARVRALADVRRDAHHQPRPRRPRGARRLRRARRARPRERLAVRRAHSRAPADAGRRLRAAAHPARAQPALGRARAPADHVRARDRDPEPAAAAVLARRALARRRCGLDHHGELADHDQLSIPAIGVLILALAILVLGGLQLFLSRTAAGRAMRATAEDPDTAELVGVDARAVYARATAIAVATAALAGRVPRDPLDVRPAERADAADLRVRGGRDRRLRLALGDAARRHRARRRADHRGADRPAVLRSSPGTSSSSTVLATSRGGLLAGREAA